MAFFISTAYAIVHIVYKLESDSFVETLKVLKNSYKLLFLLAIISTIFAIPSLLLAPLNISILVLALTLYWRGVIKYLEKKHGESYKDLYKAKNIKKFFIIMGITGLLLIGLSLVMYFYRPLFNLTLLEEIKSSLKPYYSNAQFFDELQRKVIELIFGPLKGYKG